MLVPSRGEHFTKIGKIAKIANLKPCKISRHTVLTNLIIVVYIYVYVVTFRMYSII